MGQQEVYTFLEQHKGNFFNAEEVSKMVGQKKDNTRINLKRMVGFFGVKGIRGDLPATIYGISDEKSEAKIIQDYKRTRWQFSLK